MQGKPAEEQLLKNFSRCDPRVVRAIRETFNAFKPMADGLMDNETLMKKCVSIVAAFEYNCDQLRKKRSPLIIGNG